MTICSSPTVRVGWTLVAVLLASGSVGAQDKRERAVSFRYDVLPIVTKLNCTKCHHSKYQGGRLLPQALATREMRYRRPAFP